MKKIISGILLLTILPFMFLLLLLGGGGSTVTNDEGEATSSCETSSSLDDLKFNEEIFKKIIKQKGNAYADKADVIIKISKKAGVNPLLFASILANESGWGTSDAIRNHNNPSGQMIGSKILDYPTLDKGLEATGDTLHDLVVVKQFNTIEKLGAHYAPVGASNDPNNMNINWIPGVKSIMNMLNGGKADETIGISGCSLDDTIPSGNKLLDIAKTKIGKTYLLGAPEVYNKNASVFDCGLFTRWVYVMAGYKPSFNRNAQNQYNSTKRIDKPKAGDFIFFENTYPAGERITHVGLVIDGKKFIGANSDGVEVADYSSGYWKQHLAGFGRYQGK